MNKEIQRLVKRLALGRVVESYPVTITTTRVLDRQVQFCTNFEQDPIQRKHRKGVFYEIHELQSLADHFPKGGTFVDIGANVGNHSLFAAMFLDAARVIPFEPNPKVYRLLIQNMLANGVAERVDFSRLGCGVSDVEDDGFRVEDRQRNLGGAKLLKEGGALQVFRADTLLADETPDLIKIDVEGMELEVLRGLSGVMARCKPAMLVEVDVANDEGFQAWVAEMGYEVAETVKRYRDNRNYLLIHPDAAKPAPQPKTSAKKTASAKKTTAAKKTPAKRPATAATKTAALSGAT